jgi:Domain of unknown function (DUF4331)
MSGAMLKWLAVRVAAGLLAVLSPVTLMAPGAWGASHREAPLIALDPTADLTDVYAFRSWENPDRLVLIMNVIPAQVPASGPNFFNLDDQVLYAFHLDLNQDGKADDLDIEFRFNTEIRDNSGAGALNFKDVPISFAGVPPITALDGPGSAGIGLRQHYTVRAVSRTAAGKHVAQAIGTRSSDVNGSPLIAVPSNVGPATIPDYSALAAQGVFNLAGGIRVFVGQREETFYIDLGATFDTLNFRRKPPILTVAEDLRNDQNAFGVDDGFEGLNVTTIAIEIPMSLLGVNTLGMYASTSRPRNRHLRDDGTSFGAGQFVQVARLANPLVNEVIIGTGFKDFWNSQEPENESQFLDFYETSRLAFLINAVFGTSFPTTNRDDIKTVLLQYFPPVFSAPPGIISELLRVNLAIPPTAPANQRRLTVLSSLPDATFGCVSTVDLGLDPAGWPNGRRPNDDVTDIALRVVAGVLLNPVPCLGDGVNVNRVRVGTPDVNPGNNVALTFPFLPTPNPGRSPASPLQSGPNEPLFR